MYHRVLTPLEDRNVHRFLWRNLGTDRPPDTYVMNVLTFGDKPVPAMAQIAACTIKGNTYMDDILDSMKTTEEAKKLTTDIDHILKNGGFKVKGWQSNKNVCKSILEINEIKVPQGRTEAKVLGVAWNSSEDTLKYKVEIEAIKSCITDLTKRKILRQIA